jgi:hypothetical protein
MCQAVTAYPCHAGLGVPVWRCSMRCVALWLQFTTRYRQAVLHTELISPNITIVLVLQVCCHPVGHSWSACVRSHSTVAHSMAPCPAAGPA